MTMLVWSILEFPHSYGDLLSEAKELIAHGIEYLFNCAPDSSSLYVVVGNQTAEDEFWGRPSDFSGSRPVEQINPRRPGSDIAAEVAAALAAGSLLYNEEPSMQEIIQDKAKGLLQFAESTGAIGHESVPAAGKYKSSDYFDELAWANMWLFKATNSTSFYENAKGLYEENEYLRENPKIFNINTKVAGVQLLLALQESEDENKGIIRTNRSDVNNVTYCMVHTHRNSLILE